MKNIQGSNETVLLLSQKEVLGWLATEWIGQSQV